MEPSAQQQAPVEQGSPEKGKESPVEPPQGQTSETVDPLNTYKWHTGSKGTLDEEGDGGTSSATSTAERYQKASNKWSKMQNWRKTLSEDSGDKNSSGGKGAEGAKSDKGAGAGKKNPFRRALSEPPGSLLAVLSPAFSSHAASSSSAGAEASGVTSADPSQKGSGGAIFKKYLRTVSQKFKRPLLQSRTSTTNLLPGKPRYIDR